MSINSLLKFEILNKLSSKEFRENSPVGPIEEMIQTFMDVEFGVLSKNCENYGICRVEGVRSIEFGNIKKKGSCKKRSASILTVFSNGQLEMAFPKTTMKPETAEKYFRNGRFIVEEDFIMPAQSGFEGLERDCRIEKGRYPVIETKGFYIVCFNE